MWECEVFWCWRQKSVVCWGRIVGRGIVGMGRVGVRWVRGVLWECGVFWASKSVVLVVEKGVCVRWKRKDIS